MMKQQNYVGGFHTVLALLVSAPQSVMQIFLLSGRKDQRCEMALELANQHGIAVQFCSRRELNNLFPQSRIQHQGVAAQCAGLPDFSESFLKAIVARASTPLLLLILDGVQDPHNLGACLRTANGFAVDAVILPKDRACGLTATVLKVACGAANITPLIRVTNLSRTLKWLQAQQVWLVAMLGQTDALVSDIDLTGHIGIVLGSEGQGMRKLTQQHCDYHAKIPMTGSVESFNVSVAAAIALYECVRQRS